MELVHRDTLIHCPVSQCSCAPKRTRDVETASAWSETKRPRIAPRCASPLTHHVIRRLQEAGVTVYNAGIVGGALGVTTTATVATHDVVNNTEAVKSTFDACTDAAVARLAHAEERVVAAVWVTPRLLPGRRRHMHDEAEAYEEAPEWVLQIKM